MVLFCLKENLDDSRIAAGAYAILAGQHVTNILPGKVPSVLSFRSTLLDHFDS